MDQETALSAGHTAKTAEAVSTYGAEILTFLASVHGDRDEACEVFSEACEDLLRSIPMFRGECSMRTWFYAIAKNASRRHFADPYRKRRAALEPALDLETPVRTATATFLRTEWKDKFRALRERLDPEDRTLLVLRVDRGMAWDEIARVLDEEKTPASSAALRKRFERIKTALRTHAIELGFPIGQP